MFSQQVPSGKLLLIVMVWPKNNFNFNFKLELRVR